MKLSTSPSHIVGLQLGEASLNMIRGGQPPIKAKFALITKEGDAIGFMETAGPWSDKVLEALKTFSEVLEEELLGRISEVPQASETPPAGASNEPPQF
jgi:hypothetical protein